MCDDASGDAIDVRCLKPFGALSDLELDPIPLFQRTKSVSIDGAIVNEYFLAIFHRNEAVALFWAEPLDSTLLSHFFPPYLLKGIP